jgi:hypothetical protein
VTCQCSRQVCASWHVVRRQLFTILNAIYIYAHYLHWAGDGARCQAQATVTFIPSPLIAMTADKLEVVCLPVTADSKLPAPLGLTRTSHPLLSTRTSHPLVSATAPVSPQREPEKDRPSTEREGRREGEQGSSLACSEPCRLLR